MNASCAEVVGLLDGGEIRYCPARATHRLPWGTFNCNDHGHPQNRRSAVVVIMDRYGLILSISRGENLKDLGLVGGKVNPEDLTDAHAAVREAFEESGAIMALDTMVPIYSRLDKATGRNGTDDFLATAFIGQVIEWGKPTHAHEGTLTWVKPRELLTNECSFREYNEILFRQMGLI